MIGHVKMVSYDKGFGFITVRNQPRDIYFKIKDVADNRVLRVGDQVEVEAYLSAPGKSTARRVVPQTIPTSGLGSTHVPRNQQGVRNPYYGKPTYVASPGSKADGVFVGTVVGAMLGPVGAFVGALIGAAASGGTKLLTQTCLKCGGTGHVTAITASHIGYQCEHCRSFWKGRNKENVKAAELLSSISRP